LILNGAVEYSYNWHAVKRTPKLIVIASAIIVSRRCPAIIERCAHVTLTPDDSKITVFNKGNPQGFSTFIPCGGQTHPIAIEGDKLA